MWGLALEVGPFRLEKGKNGTDDFKIIPAEKAWTDDYHVIFLDQPIGTGFSWPEDIDINMDRASIDFLNFMYEFYKMYPDLLASDFILTGESYAGKYVPKFAVEILQAN